MKKLAILSFAMGFAVVLATGSALADTISIYTAKFACGDGGFSAAAPAKAGGVTNAYYRTAINIVNPSNRGVTINKQVVFTEARSVNGVSPDITGQSPELPEATVETDSLPVRGSAVEWDCDQLGTQLNHDFGAGGFAKGFLIITSDAVGTNGNAPVNVVGVYTTIGKLAGDLQTSIDVEEIKGRVLNDAANQIAHDHHEDGN